MPVNTGLEEKWVEKPSSPVCLLPRLPGTASLMGLLRACGASAPGNAPVLVIPCCRWDGHVT